MKRKKGGYIPTTPASFTVGFAFVIAGVILTFFFVKYDGHVIPLPWLWMLGSMGMVYGGWRLMSWPERRAAAEAQSDIDILKATGRRYTVDLSKCEVGGWTHTTEAEVYDGPRHSGMMPQTISVPEGSHVTSTRREGHAVIKSIESSESRVRYQMEINGQLREFASLWLKHDKVSVTFLIEAQKTTTLYIDPYDPTHYYLDMEFLDS